MLKLINDYIIKFVFERFFMLKYFTPDFMFEKYSDVTVDFLKSIGVSALIIDIDNTLVPYEQPIPDERIFVWFASLAEAGIKATLISNNNESRVKIFNENLKLTAFSNACKPKRKFLIQAMNIMKSTKENTAVLGDQLFTDCFAGKRLHLYTIIIPPIKDKPTLLFKIKRSLEKPIIKKFKRSEAKNDTSTKTTE